MDFALFPVQQCIMQTTIGDMRISFRRTLSGRTLATIRLATAAEIRWHRISFPPGTPAYALYETCAQEVIRKFASVPGATETWMQCPLQG